MARIPNVWEENVNQKELSLLAVGDIIDDTTQPDEPFALVAPIFRSADVVIGQG